MIELRNVSLRMGDKQLLEDASLMLKRGSKTGLVGRNGSGKTTLFKVLLGELHPESGDVVIPKNARLSAARQETPSSQISALDWAKAGDVEAFGALGELREAEKRNDGQGIAAAHAKLTDLDYYSLEARAAALLSGLGFADEDMSRPVSSFSGGWRMRLNLARALIRPCDLLLLDEPTNHLDVEAIVWLEDWLAKREGAQILISHDREFLNRICDGVIELSNKKLTYYGGDFDAYEKEKAARLKEQEGTYKKQQARVAHLRSYIDRFRYKATKARQAQSRIKQLEKMELIVAPASCESGVELEFFRASEAPNPLLTARNGVFGYEPGKPVVSGVNLSLERGARIGLLGINGAGKSTFVKTLEGSLPPLQGRIDVNKKTRIGYFAQHQLDALRIDQSPLWHLRQIKPDETEARLRSILGSYGFSGDAAVEPAQRLSGGEKSRLALAGLILREPNLLLMDEPTNHLDLPMREALAMALQGFDGALVIIAHDRSLLSSVCDEFWLIEDGKIAPFDGDLRDYEKRVLAARLDRARQKKTQSQAEKRKDGETPNLRSREAKKAANEAKRRIDEAVRPLKKELRALEERIAQSNAEIERIDAKLLELGSADGAGEEMQRLLVARAAAAKSVEQDEEDSLGLMERIERIEKGETPIDSD